MTVIAMALVAPTAAAKLELAFIKSASGPWGEFVEHLSLT